MMGPTPRPKVARATRNPTFVTCPTNRSRDPLGSMLASIEARVHAYHGEIARVRLAMRARISPGASPDSREKERLASTFVWGCPTISSLSGGRSGSAAARGWADREPSHLGWTVGEDRECEHQVEEKCHGPADEGAKPSLRNKLRFRMPMEAMARQN